MSVCYIKSCSMIEIGTLWSAEEMSFVYCYCVFENYTLRQRHQEMVQRRMVVHQFHFCLGVYAFLGFTLPSNTAILLSTAVFVSFFGPANNLIFIS